MDEPEVVFIYALVDPETLAIRYVGKSNNPRKRLSTHLSERSLKARNEKNTWLKSLLARGLRPILILLQEVRHGCWAEAERGWIAIFRTQGCPLTNSSDGGEGVFDLGPEARIIPRSELKMNLPDSHPRKGGLIPRRPGAAPLRQEPERPRRGQKGSRQHKDGTDREHLPSPPRRRKTAGRKPRKKSG